MKVCRSVWKLAFLVSVVGVLSPSLMAATAQASSTNRFFYIEPFFSYFYNRIDGQSYTTGTVASLISASNFAFGFHERFNYQSGWAFLASEQLSQIQYYSDPTTNVNFRQTVYSDYNIGVGNNNELINIFEYSAHLGVKERGFFVADTLAYTGIDKFFVYYSGVTLFTRFYRDMRTRIGLGLTGDYLLGQARSSYNVNDGNSGAVSLRWEEVLGTNQLNVEAGYVTTTQNTNKNTAVEQNIYAQAMFSIVF
jgi:hypothetical protein